MDDIVNIKEMNSTFAGQMSYFAPHWAYYLYFIILQILALVSVVSNSLTICIFVKNPLLPSVSSNFIVQLAIADVISGSLSPVSLLLHILYDFVDTDAWHIACIVKETLAYIVVSFDVILTLLIAIDRALSVCIPVQYSITKSTTLMKKIVACSWLVSIGFATGVTVSALIYNVTDIHLRHGICYMSNYLQFCVQMLCAVLLLVESVGTCLLYYLIYCVIRERAKMSRASIKSPHTNLANSEMMEDIQHHLTPQEQLQQHITETMKLVWILHVLCYISSVCIQIMYFFPNHYVDILYIISSTLFHARELANAFIYAGKNPGVKSAYKDVLHHCFGKYCWCFLGNELVNERTEATRL